MFISEEESKEKAVFDGGSVCHHFFFLQESRLGWNDRQAWTTCHMGVHLPWTSPFPPPPRSSSFNLIDVKKGKEREQAKIKGQRLRSEATGASFFFFFLCVCVCLCLIFDIACLSFWLQSQPEILRSLFHVYWTRERKKRAVAYA